MDGQTLNDSSDRALHSSSNVSFLRILFDDALVTPQVLHYQYEGGGTESDPYVCEFIPDDARNPMNWSSTRKWVVALCTALTVFGIAFCSSAYTGAIGSIMADMDCSLEVATLGLSLFVIGYVIGPLFWAPMSELYGRRILFIGTYGALVIFNIGVLGARNIITVLVLRTLAGTFGSSPLTNSGGVIADVFDANQRGLATALFSAAPLAGPVLGPVVSSFVGESSGWRWVMGIMAIVTGALLLLGIFAVPETYAPVLLERRAKALSKITGKVFRTRMQLASSRPTPLEALAKALSRPWVLLFREPIVLVTSIYIAILYGTLYLMFGAFPIVYQAARGWSAGIAGLVFIGLLVGMLSAIAYSIPDNSRRYMRLVQEAKSRGELRAAPEARLPPCILGSVVLIVGLFWFAWTNGPEIHWIISVIALVPFGFGMVLASLSILNYLIDSYTVYAASVIAANGLLRSLFSAVFPLFTPKMYESLGIHWASSIPGFLALALAPFPLLFYKYGARLRQKCKYTRQADELLNQMLGIGKKQEGVEPREESEAKATAEIKVKEVEV